MTKNNEVCLIGNVGGEPKVIDKNDRLFVVFTLATQDSYKDDNDQWQNKQVVWHNNLLAFNSTAMSKAKGLGKGDRIKVTGSLSYRPFEAKTADGSIIAKNEVSIIVSNIEPAPL